jgi:hypothetical protein
MASPSLIRMAILWHFSRFRDRPLNDNRVFGIKDEDRFLHVYIIGKTGTGPR